MEIKIADINYDGLPDLLTVNDDGNDVSFFYQRTDRTYSPVPDFSLYIGETPTSAAVEDLNRDGLLDLVVVDHGCFFPTLNCNMTVFYQRPDYSFPFVPDQVVGRDDMVPWEIAAGDYNSDGLLDVAMSGDLNGGVYVYLQLISGGFPNAPDWTLWTPPGASFGIAGADLNNDGLDDVALANFQSWSVSIYYQKSNHALPIVPDVNLSSGDGPTKVTVGDVNGDGLTDIVVTDSKEHTFSVFYQRSNYTFLLNPDEKINTGGTGNFVPMHAAVGDVNDDGLADLVVTDATRDSAHVYLQSAVGGFSPAPSFVLDAQVSWAAAIGDLNGDGLNDIVMTTVPIPPAENVYLFYQEAPGLPPVTTVSIGNPRIGGALPLITSLTPLSFDVIDRSGMGIAATYYRVNGSSWQTYPTGTTFNLLAEGVNTIDFYSVDNASLVEQTNTRLLSVDNTAPATNISIGNPHLQSSQLWVSPATNISLTAIDGSSPSAGVDATAYRTWDSTGWSPWFSYSAPFTLNAEGTNIIEYRSSDFLGNLESERNASLIVDATPPTSFIAAPFVLNGSRALSLSAIDTGVGVSSTRSSVDGGPWQNHSTVVYLSGTIDHQVNYRSEDLLGNIEQERIMLFQRSSAGPLTSLLAGSPSHGVLPLFVTSSTPLGLFAQDQSGSGVNRTSYNIDNNVSWTDYVLPFSLVGEGAHEVSYYSVDNLGQVGPTETSMLVVDDTGPDAWLVGKDGPHILGTSHWATSSSTFGFQSEDRGMIPVGSRDTLYRFWTPTGWSPSNTFSVPFSLGPPEGLRWVSYQSTDLLGNVGPEVNSSVSIDDTPPATAFLAGTPSYRSPELYVTSSTPLVLSSTESGPSQVGTNTTLFRVWDNAWSPWSDYRQPVIVTGQDGVRFLEYTTSDLLDNSETVQNVTIFLDNTPPSTTLSPATGPYTTDTVFTLAATDSGCGVNVTMYRVDGGGWIVYSGGFTLPAGVHNISYYSTDQLDNTEAVRWREVTVQGATQPPSSDVFSQYWWLIVIIVAVVIVLFLLLLLKRRKPKEEPPTERQNPRVDESSRQHH